VSFGRASPVSSWCCILFILLSLKFFSQIRVVTLRVQVQSECPMPFHYVYNFNHIIRHFICNCTTYTCVFGGYFGRRLGFHTVPVECSAKCHRNFAKAYALIPSYKIKWVFAFNQKRTIPYHDKCVCTVKYALFITGVSLNLWLCGSQWQRMTLKAAEQQQPVVIHLARWKESSSELIERHLPGIWSAQAALLVDCQAFCIDRSVPVHRGGVTTIGSIITNRTRWLQCRVYCIATLCVRSSTASELHRGNCMKQYL